MMPTTAKACGQYVNSVLAIREAVNRGFAEAILPDAGGQIAEGSGENLFIVSDHNCLRTIKPFNSARDNSRRGAADRQ